MRAAFATIPISHESLAVGSAIRQDLTPEGMFNMLAAVPDQGDDFRPDRCYRPMG
jgi:hypothetical protein